MSRPFMQHGVAQLEQLFHSSRSNPQVLKQLEKELRYRQVPRAVSLLAEVQGALYAPRSAIDHEAASEEGVLRQPPSQPGLFSPASAGQPSIEVSTPRIAATAPGANGPARKELPPPDISLSDAFKLLKATPASTWESVEKTRRQMIDSLRPSHPRSLAASEQKSAREQARRINAAYELLSLSRAGLC